MFGKLMKYELRYLIRIFAPMWAVVLALCVMTRLTIGPKLTGSNLHIEGNEAILPAIIVMVTVFAIMTMMIVAAVVLIQRFYKGMYGDEGYLMFTLPVTTGGLIHSKALSAMLMLLGTGLLTWCGVLVMVSYPQLWSELKNIGFWEVMASLPEMYGVTGAELVMNILWGFAAGVIATAGEIYMVYLAISLGQLWKKHPVAGGIVAFYGLSVLLGAVEAMTGLNYEFVITNNMVMEGSMQGLLLYMTLRSLMVLVISFLGTKLILDKKLNIS